MFLQIPLTYLQQFCTQQLTLYTYQNYIEVITLSWLIYKILIWVAQDYTKPLAIYVYTYSGILICCNIIQAYTLMTILLISAPIFAIICIVIHQKNIQKYFASKPIYHFDSKALPSNTWIDILIRNVLFAAHHKKNIFCIIMRNDNVQPFITPPYTLNIAIQPKILDLLFSSSLLENPTIILIDKFGTIKYLNATWSPKIQEYMMSNHHHSTLEHCYQAASIITNKTDAIIWYINPTDHLATTWCDGSIFQNMNIDQLFTLCKKLIPVIQSTSTSTHYASHPISSHNNINIVK